MATIKQTHHTLLWSSPPLSSQNSPQLPENITRHFILTPHGNLELLLAQPPESVPLQSKAILFQHGGFGYASVWLPYLSYFSEKGYRCYALSLRGHGASWKPGFFQMVWRFGKKDFAQDLGSAFMWVAAFETAKREGRFGSEDLVLVGHSAGGGLSQYFLSQGLGEVGGLVVMAPFPFFGGLGVYINWFKLDPWFAPRYYTRDLWHPRSPLSSTSLVHRAFFSPEYPVEQVREFEQQMPEYESMRLPLGMMFTFANPTKILNRIIGWKKDEKDGKDGKEGKEGRRKRVLVLAGEKDRLMSVGIMERLAGGLRKAVRRLGLYSEDEGEKKGGEEVVGFEVVKGSGHHIQNDLYWADGAGKILAFVEQL